MNRTRKFRSKDYPEICSWWLKYNETILDLKVLSKIGIVLFEENKLLAATWLYYANAKICQIGWTIVNPDIGPRNKIECLSKILNEGTKLAKKNGYNYIQSFSNKSALTKMMIKSGFECMKPHDFLVKRI